MSKNAPKDEGCILCGQRHKFYVEDERGHKFCSIKCQDRWYEMYAEFVDSVMSEYELSQVN